MVYTGGSAHGTSAVSNVPGMESLLADVHMALKFRDVAIILLLGAVRIRVK
jgi:hypothetical protein